ncbi:DUF5825 family protein [Streptomyces sp. NPDC001817]|uniref:DUF5825 family protein n=1 Tax=Streptomyces sp. NPDC001817 TaxID=3154398 RepID=UPI00332731B5
MWSAARPSTPSRRRTRCASCASARAGAGRWPGGPSYDIGLLHHLPPPSELSSSEGELALRRAGYAYGSLHHRRGPGFVTVLDRRAAPEGPYGSPSTTPISSPPSGWCRPAAAGRWPCPHACGAGRCPAPRSDRPDRHRRSTSRRRDENRRGRKRSTRA